MISIHYNLNALRCPLYAIQDSLYSSRECSTNQTFYTKQTQFFPIFQPKTTIPQKNKPNSNPISSKAKTNAFSRKGDYTMKNNDLLAKLTTLKGANFVPKTRINYENKPKQTHSIWRIKIDTKPLFTNYYE